MQLPRRPLGALLFVTLLCVGGLCGSAEAAKTRPEVETLYFETGSQSQDGYENLTVQVRYVLSICHGYLKIEAALVPGSTQFATGYDPGNYWYRGVRYPVPQNIPLPDEGRYGIDVTGTVMNGGSTAGRFRTIGKYRDGFGDCGGLGDVVTEIPAEVKKGGDAAIEDYLQRLTVDFDRLPPETNRAVESALEAQAQAQAQKEAAAQQQAQQQQQQQQDPSASGSAQSSSGSGSAANGDTASLSPEEQRQRAEEARAAEQQRKVDEVMENIARKQREDEERRAAIEEQQRQQNELATEAAQVAAPIVEGVGNAAGEMVGNINALVPNYTDLEASCRMLTDFNSTGEGCQANVRAGGIIYGNLGVGYQRSPQFEKYEGEAGTGFAYIDDGRSVDLMVEMGAGGAFLPNRMWKIRLDIGAWAGPVFTPTNPTLGVTESKSGFGWGLYGAAGATFRIPDSAVAFSLSYQLRTMRYDELDGGHVARDQEGAPPLAFATNGWVHSLGIGVIYRHDWVFSPPKKETEEENP